MSNKKINKFRILGLDISTSVIGICVIEFVKSSSNVKSKIIYIDYYIPIKNSTEDKNRDFLHTLLEAKSHILNIIKKYKPSHVAVEDFIRFMKGKSGSSTIIPLSNLNRTLCLAVHENYKNIPLHIYNVISIRTRLKKENNREDLPAKEEVPEILEKMLNITIPRPMRKTRTGEKISGTHWDMGDAVAAAYHCFKSISADKNNGK